MSQPVMTSERLLAPSEAAHFLGVSTETLKSWRYRRMGPPYVRLGRTIRYQEAELIAWTDAQKVGAE